MPSFCRKTCVRKIPRFRGGGGILGLGGGGVPILFLWARGFFWICTKSWIWSKNRPCWTQATAQTAMRTTKTATITSKTTAAARTTTAAAATTAMRTDQQQQWEHINNKIENRSTTTTPMRTDRPQRWEQINSIDTTEDDNSQTKEGRDPLKSSSTREETGKPLVPVVCLICCLLLYALLRYIMFFCQDAFDHDKGQKPAILGRRLHWIFLNILQWMFPFFQVLCVV